MDSGIVQPVAASTTGAAHAALQSSRSLAYGHRSEPGDAEIRAQMHAAGLQMSAAKSILPDLASTDPFHR